ncbi:DcaP family trimeric outer membrane transporter [Aeoliella mucimassa]|uniref:Porin subfamily protein n=1 Tax=Aeoliella mucimassa TaxID=2527972 RepID=A0A518ALW2_9BACT|nr:DcaP family trimeric outer membrane transporter [Aeoliella mucimassa]QDU55720.1 hypothetical protein Pan181_19140 [Aeoliella mucimassa]
MRGSTIAIIACTLVLALMGSRVGQGTEPDSLAIRRLPPLSRALAEDLTPPANDSIFSEPVTTNLSATDLSVTGTSTSDPLVTPIDYTQPVTDTLELFSANPPIERFQSEAFRQASYRSLKNDFTRFPEFKEGIIIASDNIAMKIGGYVKADLIRDFDAITSTDSFNTTTIPTSGPGWQNARFHARQSRLSCDTRWRTSGEVVRVFFEGDFFGGSADSPSFRLRHAYGTVGRFTAGQTWTTFTDPSAVPQTIDFEGAISNVNVRQGLVRWDQPLWDDCYSVAVALEDPQVSIEAPSMVVGEARTEMPDLVARLRYKRDWGELRAAYVLRTLGFQPDGQEVIEDTGWGWNFTGSVFVMPDTRGYFQITFGDGIGSYRGTPDVVATGPNSAAMVHSLGWMVGVHHAWNDSLTSNVTFSRLANDDIPGQDGDNLKGMTYLAVNLIANPYERVFCGVEYLYGVRDDVSGATGHANRLQASFGFYLP